MTPPEIELERASWLGRHRVRVKARSEEGLRHGWVALDGQKEDYVAWNGSPGGELETDIGDGDHDVTTKVETMSGVSVIDNRRLIED